MTEADAARPKGAERASRARQRQRLIEACISALHEHGPSRTTIDKVVAIADMSPGIVNFYFDTKAALLVASLEFLALEFEDRVLRPVGAARAEPARALEVLIDLYLDPAIASPRKVSVWYAFWGEASARAEYYAICGKRDLAFAALVREIVAARIAERGDRHLDADAVALGLIGCLEILWQEIAFREEGAIDRGAQRQRCRAYLASVFPPHAAPGSAPSAAPPGLDLLVAAQLTRAGIPAACLPSPAGAVLAHPPRRRPQAVAVVALTAPGSVASVAGAPSADWFAFVLSARAALDPPIYIVPGKAVREAEAARLTAAEIARRFKPYRNNFGLA